MFPNYAVQTYWDQPNTGWKTGAIIQILPDVIFQLSMMNIPKPMSPFPPGYKRGGVTGLTVSGWNEMVIGQGARFGTWHPPKHHQASMNQNALSEFSDEEKWNSRVAWHLGNVGRGVAVTLYDGTVYAAALVAGHIAQVQAITPDPVRFPDLVQTRVTTSVTTWIPECTEDGNRLWPTWVLASAENNRELLGVTIGYIETWQLAGTLVPVSILRGLDQSDLSSLDSLFALSGRKNTSTMTTSSESLNSPVSESSSVSTEQE